MENMRHRFWAATRKAVLRTRGRGGAGKPLKRRAPPRAPAEPRTPSRPQAPRLPQGEDADTDPGCPGHPGFPAPVGALLPAPPRYSSWERNAGLLTCLLGTHRGGVESWTGRAQGPGPAPCQRSPGQRRHCTGRQSPRSPGLELSAVTAPTRLWALPRLKCKHTEAELLESVLTNYLIKRS